MPDRYALEVRVTMRRVTEHGGWTNDQLSVDDRVEVEAPTFLEVAGILGQFHELGESIRRAHQADASG